MGAITDQIESLRKSFKSAYKQAYKLSIVELAQLIKEKYERMYEETVDDFYGSYSPIYYDRTWSLYDMLDIEADDRHMRIEFDTDVLPHPSLDDTLFVGGYHGGASHNGGIYWRTPHPYYTRWGRPAYRTSSPYYDIDNKMTEYESSEMESDFAMILENNIDNLLGY